MCAYQAIRMYNFTSCFAKYKAKIISSFIPRLSTRSFSNTQLAIDSINNLKRDVLLYSYEKTKWFKFLSIVGAAQLGIWTFYGGFMFITLKDLKKSEIKTETFTESSLWKSINLGDDKLRIFCTSLCVGVGLLTAIVCCVLPTRIIKELTLLKGGNSASIVTYGPFGRTKTSEIPLKKLSCLTTRAQAKGFLAVKIKPKWFYYLIDCKGKFHQPQLFDYSIGTRTAKVY